MKRAITIAIAAGSFAGGFVLGAYLMREKMKDRYINELDNMDKYYKEKYEVTNGDNEETEEISEEVVSEATNIIENEGYVEYDNISIGELKWIKETPIDPAEEAVSTPEPDEYEIEVIDPSLYGEDPEFNMVNLTYYADGYLVDEYDNVIHDIDELIGPAALDTFGDFEDDAVHVKNNAKSTYYEVIKSDERFSDVVWETKIKPRR